MRFCWFFVSVVVGTALIAPVLAGSRSQESRGQSPIRVQVEVVSINVIVSDKNGRYISGLTKDNFRIFEDKREQKITNFSPVDQPFDVVLVLDTSGSMKGRLWRLQDESINFVRLLHPDDEVAVVSFDDEVRLESDFSMDRDRILRGIKSTRVGGSTQVYEAVYLSLDQVLGPRQARKAMVLFTDGVDTSSRDTSRSETLRKAEESDALIYSIRFNTSRDRLAGRRRGVKVGPGLEVPLPVPIDTRRSRGGIGRGYPDGSMDLRYQAAAKYLKDLGKRSGGRVFDADTLDDLSGAFQQVANELRHQYSIGYVSDNLKRDGKLRRLKVTVDRPGTVVRTRRGYYAPKKN